MEQLIVRKLAIDKKLIITIVITNYQQKSNFSIFFKDLVTMLSRSVQKPSKGKSIADIISPVMDSMAYFSIQDEVSYTQPSPYHS